MATNVDRLARIRELVASGTNSNMENAELLSQSITDERIRSEANEVFAAVERSRLAPASSAASSAASAAFAPAPASAAGAGAGALPPAAKSTLSASSFNIYNSGVASPAAAAAAAPSPISAALSSVKTPDEVKAALKGSLESMITIARTGGVDLGTVRGLPTVPGAAAEAAPKIIIVKDPTGASICATEMFSEEITLGGRTFPTALKFYMKTIEDLSKPAPGRFWGTRAPPKEEYVEKIMTVRSTVIEPRIREITNITPLPNAPNVSGEAEIKTKYLEFLNMFREDILNLVTVYKASEIKDLADYLNQKFQRSLRKALEVDELRHAMKHGKSALAGEAKAALAARNTAVQQASELQTRINELEIQLRSASVEPSVREALQAQVEQLTQKRDRLKTRLTAERERATKFGVALDKATEDLGKLTLEKAGKEAEAEYNRLISGNNTIGHILSALPETVPGRLSGDRGAWMEEMKNNINNNFEGIYSIKPADADVVKYNKWINRLKMYKHMKSYVTDLKALYDTSRAKPIKDRADQDIIDKYELFLRNIAFMDNDKPAEHIQRFAILLQNFSPLPQSGGYSRRATRHRARRNRAKTQRRLRR